MFSRFFYPVAKLMLIFATLIVLAFRSRSNPPAHKRLILVGIPAVCLVASLNLTSKAFVSRECSGGPSPLQQEKGPLEGGAYPAGWSDVNGPSEWRSATVRWSYCRRRRSSMRDGPC